MVIIAHHRYLLPPPLSFERCVNVLSMFCGLEMEREHTASPLSRHSVASLWPHHHIPLTFLSIVPLTLFGLPWIQRIVLILFPLVLSVHLYISRILVWCLNAWSKCLYLEWRHNASTRELSWQRFCADVFSQLVLGKDVHVKVLNLNSIHLAHDKDNTFYGKLCVSRPSLCACWFTYVCVNVCVSLCVCSHLGLFSLSRFVSAQFVCTVFTWVCVLFNVYVCLVTFQCVCTCVCLRFYLFSRVHVWECPIPGSFHSRVSFCPLHSYSHSGGSGAEKEGIPDVHRLHGVKPHVRHQRVPRELRGGPCRGLRHPLPHLLQ